MDQDNRLVQALEAKLHSLAEILQRRDQEIKSAMEDLRIVVMAMNSPQGKMPSLKIDSAKAQKTNSKIKIYQDKLPERGELQVVDKEEMLIKDNVRVKLTTREYTFFKYLYKQAGKPVTRAQLTEQLHQEQELTERNVDVHIFSLRKKVSRVGIKIETVWGTGYKLTL